MEEKGKRAKILFVDDDKNIRLLYEKVFSEEGYEVLLAESGEKALEVLKENEDIDLVVLDIKMKGQSGLEPLQHIVKEKRKLPVILCSAYSSFQDDFTSWLADAYVVKSPDLSELKFEIKKALEKRKSG